MAAVQKVGIVGSGAAGTTAAVLLARQGLDVEILEAASEPTSVGSGITLQGNALRVLRELGVWDEVERHGYGFSTLGLRAPDPEATVLVVMDDIRTGGPDLPATVGMYRPDLARIVRAKAEQEGARITYGARVVDLADDGEQVTVTLDDGRTRSYDLLIGADGLNSVVRRMIGIEVTPRRTGMGIWRALVPRPAEVVRTDLIYGGRCYIAGYCPTGEDSIYAYLVEEAQERSTEDGPVVMSELAASYGGPWKEIRAHLTDGANINYTHFTTHFVEGAWHRGRVVIIGDAAHSCPPTIAQGAAMAFEDAAVLAELLTGAEELTDELLQELVDRRAPRARTVVDASVQLGQWLIDGERDADVPGLVGSVSHLVREPV